MADRLRLAAACLWILGCHGAPTRAPDPAPPSAPSTAVDAPSTAAALPSCRDRWSDTNAGDYDHGRDAKQSAHGNLGYSDYAARSERERCRKTWTVLVYMAADNEDLPLHAYWNLDDIETTVGAASTQDHDVIVHLDLEDPSGLRRLHLFHDPQAEPATSAADFAEATPARIRSPIVDLREDERRPAAEELQDFVRWGIERYPAEHTAVVVWGHGQGWRPAGGSAGPVRYEEREGGFVGGIAFDHSQGEVLDIPSLAAALEAATDDAADTTRARLDLLLLDACLMQSVEVAAALTDTADFIGAYEPIAPYPGLPYRTLLPRLDEDPPTAAISTCEATAAGRPCRFAASLPNLYAEAIRDGHYDRRTDTQPPAGSTFAISVIASQPLRQRVLPSLEALARALTAWIDEEPLRAIGLQDLLSPRGIPAFLGGARDLGVTLRRLDHLAAQELARADSSSATTAALQGKIAALQGDLAATVIATAAGTLYDTPRFDGGLSGLAIWLPRSAEELAARIGDLSSAPTFRSNEGAPTAWRRWIEAVYGPPGPSSSSP